MSVPPTVHIVDDDHAVRKSLELLIKSAGFKNQGYADGHDFLERYTPEKPECLLLDVRMPRMDGLSLFRELKKRGHEITTIFLTGHGDIPLAVRAMREGAYDFIEKPFDNDHLVDRIRSCVEVDGVKDQGNHIYRGAVERFNGLTPRERQIVKGLAEGKLNKVIGAELGISVRTVEAHRARIMEKLEVKSLAEMVRLYLLIEKDITP